MYTLPWKRSFILFLTLAMTAGAARAEEQVFAKTLPSSAWVLVPAGKQLWNGAGSLVDRERRLVLTCKHVVRDQKQALIFFPLYEDDRPVTDAGAYLRGKTGIRAEVLAVDDQRDLALLQLESLPDDVPALALAERSPAPGQTVFAVGNSGNTGKPLGKGSVWKQYQGKIDRLVFSKMVLSNANQTMHAWSVVLEADVKPGDSGGPLVDEQGRLVGVVNAESEGTGYAVDVDEVRLFLTRTLTRAKQAPSANALVGHWNVQFQKDDQARFFKITLRDDGQLIWDQRHTGRFGLDGNRLTMDVPALKIHETVTIAEHDDGRVTFVSAGFEFTLTRR